MEQYNYINHHTFKLSPVEKATYHYFSSHIQKPRCIQCFQSKNTIYVVKNSISKTMRDVAKITGQIKINSKCKANDRFYCKKCDIFF